MEAVMSRQLDQRSEDRANKKATRLVKALDYGLVEGLESHGAELLGLAIKHDAQFCLLTVKAAVAGMKMVAFVGSDTIVNCFLKAERDAYNGELHWKVDKYAKQTI